MQRNHSGQPGSPDVNGVVNSFVQTRIHVGGQVNNPRTLITVGPALSLLQAIARAEDPKMMPGAENQVFLIRRGPNDVPEFRPVRYNDIVWGKDPSADVGVAPYDVIYVPRSGAAEADHRFDGSLPQSVPANRGLSYVFNPGATTVIPGGAAAASH